MSQRLPHEQVDQIFKLHFNEGVSQYRIAKIFGKSRERIRQIIGHYSQISPYDEYLTLDSSEKGSKVDTEGEVTDGR